MPRIVEQHVINVIVQRDSEDISRRKALCSSFRLLLKKVRISAKSFSELSLIPLDTVYSWTAKSDRCVPPNPTAVLLLRLIEKERSVISLLEQLTSPESVHE
jgi:predicted transcriptional regulator